MDRGTDSFQNREEQMNLGDQVTVSLGYNRRTGTALCLPRGNSEKEWRGLTCRGSFVRVDLG